MTGYGNPGVLTVPGPQFGELSGTALLNNRIGNATLSLGTGLYKLVFLGDSVTQGYLATTNGRGFAHQVTALIASTYGLTNPPNYVPLSANVNYLQPFTVAPGVLGETDDSGFAGEAAYIPVGSTATSPTITCDRIWFHCQKGPAVGGGFTYSIDGGAAQGPVNAGAAAPRKGGRIWDHGAIALAAHTVVVTPNAVFGSVLEGITFFNGNGNTAGAQGFITAANANTGNGLRHWVGGHFGYTSSRYSVPGFNTPNTTDANSQALFTDPFEFIQPNCVVIFLGINDIITGISPQTFIANLRTMVGYMQTNATTNNYRMPSIVFISTYRTGSDTTAAYLNYAKAIFEFCAVNGYGFVDFSQLIGDINGNTTLTADNIHPNDLGHRILAQYIARYLTDT